MKKFKIKLFGGDTELLKKIFLSATIFGRLSKVFSHKNSSEK